MEFLLFIVYIIFSLALHQAPITINWHIRKKWYFKYSQTFLTVPLRRIAKIASMICLLIVAYLALVGLIATVKDGNCIAWNNMRTRLRVDIVLKLFLEDLMMCFFYAIIYFFILLLHSLLIFKDAFQTLLSFVESI